MGKPAERCSSRSASGRTDVDLASSPYFVSLNSHHSIHDIKKLAHDDGEVVTGWKCNIRSDQRPDTVAVITDLGSDCRILADLKPRPGLDLISAFNNCTYF